MDALLIQLLQWVDAGPRTYVEAMEAWRTSCPRMPVWEDAIGDGLVEVMAGNSLSQATVRLTEKGRATLLCSSE